MSRERSFLLLFLLIANVLFLRKHAPSPISTSLNLLRLLQADSSPTLAQSVADKLCLTYQYVAPTSNIIQNANDVAQSISNLRSKNTFVDLINEGYVQHDLVIDYIEGFVPVILALGIPLVFSLTVFIACIVNWSCMSCSCCRRARCRVCHKPKTRSAINWFTCLSILCSLSVLGASLASMSVYGNVAGNAQGTLCQTIYMMEELYDGNSGDNWLGISNIKDIFQELANDFISTGALFVKMKNNFTALDNKANDISNDLVNFHNNYSNSRVIRANPAAGEANYAPMFVTTIMDNMNYAYDELAMFRENITDAKTNFETAIEGFSTQRDAAVSAFNIGYNKSRDMGEDINSTLLWINRNGDTILTYVENFTTGLQVALAILIALALLALLSAVVNYWSKYQHMNKCIHISWFLMGIFMVIFWICAAISFPATVICTELCQVLDQTLLDANFANQTMNSFFGTKPSALKDSIVQCLHGTGQAIDNFDVRDKLGIVTDVLTELNSSSALLDSGNIPSSIATDVVTNYLTLVGTNLQVDDANTIIDLTVLNQLSHANLDNTICANVQDAWVLNNVNCTTLQLNTVLNASDPDNFNLGQSLCIPLASWMDPTNRQISTRYTDALYTACTPIPLGQTVYPRAEYLQLFVDNFVQNRQELQALVQAMNTSVNTVGIKANDLLSDARDSLKAPFIQVEDFMDGVNTTIFDPETGLYYNTQCLFVGTRVNYLNDELCIGLIPTIYQTAIALIVGAVMSSVLTLSLFLMVRKLLSQQKTTKVNRRIVQNNRQEIQKPDELNQLPVLSTS